MMQQNWAPFLRTSTLKDEINFDFKMHKVLMMTYEVKWTQERIRFGDKCVK